jgi:DNA-binding NarL/FixJ family response regulator
MTALNESPCLSRPRLVLAHSDPGYAGSVCRFYRRLGWETHLASSAHEVRSLARRLSPEVVVLSTELPDESGWLTCDKLLHENPELKVVLVANRSTPRNRHFASFVGAAALVHEEAGVQTLADEVGEVLAATT